MTRKALFAALALVCAPAISADMPGQATTVAYPLVHQVMCERGFIRGTAFRVAPTTFATAAHVAALDGCMIDGNEVSIAEINGMTDTALIQAGKAKSGEFQIDCGGYRVGEWYYAIGYANGAPYQTLVPVMATAERHRSGMQVFRGPELFIGGMSGGPVLDSEGRAVGVVNARNEEYQVSFSRAFKDTILCRS